MVINISLKVSCNFSFQHFSEMYALINILLFYFCSSTPFDTQELENRVARSVVEQLMKIQADRRSRSYSRRPSYSRSRSRSPRSRTRSRSRSRSRSRRHHRSRSRRSHSRSHTKTRESTPKPSSTKTVSVTMFKRTLLVPI